MKRIAVIFGALVLAACQPSPPDVSVPNFDSAHSVALDGVIDAGRIITESSNDATIKYQIKEQLMYTIGQLNGRNGGPDMRRLESTVTEVRPLDNNLFEVTYAAKLYVAWPRERQVPADLELVMPARGDYEGLDAFFSAFGADENDGKKCLAWEAHDVSVGIFWYYYRPEKNGCSLQNAGNDDPSVVSRFKIRLSVSGENTSGKFPEYDKVWEDGRLVVTAIFGKNDHGATSDWDAGISAYRQLYSDLIDEFGTPATSSLTAGEQPSATNDDVRLTFNVTSGTLDVHIYLVDAIRSVDSAFQAKYNERTRRSDFVSYSGHSGLGANIRALARMGTFEQGQYQIFLINGCDTFAYVDGALRDAHHAVNPDSSPMKYFDIITNAMPSYFHMNSNSNMQLVTALAAKAKTYREILEGFDRSQRASVMGEEDNRFPLPFDGE